MDINEQNSTVEELTTEQKLKHENIQLKMRICELTKALASAEQHIYKIEFDSLVSDLNFNEPHYTK